MAAGLMPWVEMRFFLDDGTPNALGTVETYLAGTSTPSPTYADTDLTTANPTTLTLDAGGRPTVDVFLPAFGLKFIVKDASGATVYTYDDVADIGQIFATSYGTQQTAGPGSAVTTGYQVLDTDRYVPIDSTGNPTVLLPPASGYSAALILKITAGAGTCAVTPDGSDTIDGVAAAFTMAAAASPIFTTLVLLSNGVDAWIVQSYTKP